ARDDPRDDALAGAIVVAFVKHDDLAIRPPKSKGVGAIAPPVFTRQPTYFAHEGGIENALSRSALQDANVPHVQGERGGCETEQIRGVRYKQLYGRNGPRPDGGFEVLVTG